MKADLWLCAQNFAFDKMRALQRATRLGGMKRSFATASRSPPRIVMLNAARLDFDGRIDLSKLSAIGEVMRHEVSAPSEVAARVEGHEVVINKE